jgi:hypothetical protein
MKILDIESKLKKLNAYSDKLSLQLLNSIFAEK